MCERVTEVRRTQLARGAGRRAIIAAAVSVVAERGFEGLTYRAVGERAHATHGLISYHFGTREALIQEVALESGRQAVASVSLLKEGGTLRDFACKLPESVEQELDNHLFQYELALQARRRPELAAIMRERYEEYYASTDDALKTLALSGLNVDLVRLVFSAIDGLAIQQLIHGDPQQTRAALDELHDLLAGLASPPQDLTRRSPPAGRTALLDAAVRLVAWHGLDGLSYREVAREAGTTPGLVFYHFGSREQLIVEAAAVAGERAIGSALLASEAPSIDTFLSRLSTSARIDIDDHLFQYEMAFNARRRPEVCAEMTRLYELYFAETERALREIGVSLIRPAFVRLVFAAIDGLVLQQVVFDAPARTDGGVRALRELLRARLG